jgi:hypothetical protein
MNAPLNLHRDAIDELLKADAAERQHIDDDGFTLRIMERLPEKKHISAAMRFAIPFACTLIATLIAVTLTPAGSFMFDAYMDIVTETVTPTLIGMAVVVVTLYAVSIGGALNDE